MFLIIVFILSYQKTESVFKSTAEKTSSIFEGITSKFSQMKNSESMRSFEDKVSGVLQKVFIFH